MPNSAEKPAFIVREDKVNDFVNQKENVEAKNRRKRLAKKFRENNNKKSV